MPKQFLLIAAVAALGAGAAAAQAPDTLHAPDLQWREMFPGVTFAPAYGDWEKEAHGKYVRILPGTEVPLHTHGNEYRAVLISGRMANLFEGGVRVELEPGAYFFMAARRPHAHDCVSEEPCFFYTYGEGNWDIALHDARE